MSYLQLHALCNIVNKEERQNAFARFYRNKKLNGLHYVNYYNDTQNISISCPNHSTHHEATSYLILMKNGSSSINTVINHSQYIKKFLDYLLIWDINILKDDLLIVMVGFVEYLKCLRRTNPPQHKSIQWSTVTSIPLHDKALSSNVVAIGMTNDGFMEQGRWEDMSYESISQTLSGALEYLMFLKERTKAYSNLQLNLLPRKHISSNSMLSGTLGRKKVEVVDTNSILKQTGLEDKTVKASISLELKVFTETQCNLFTQHISPSNHQDKLLFYMLEHFGLRRGEVVNILIDTSTLPDRLIFMNDSNLHEHLKKNLKGDLEYVEPLGKWVCSVVKRENIDSRSQHKTGSRMIPLDFNDSTFLTLLGNALKQRELLVRNCEYKHSYLFVSQKRGNKGGPITGFAVYKKFCRIVNKIYKKTDVDLTSFSPHSFRHYFATYQIRVRKRSLDDVSSWLGHTSVETTRQTYLHYIPDNYEDTNIVEDITRTFEIN